MNTRNRWLALILSLFTILILSACAPTQTISTTYFQKNSQYLTGSEIPEVMEYLRTSGADLTRDQIVEVVTLWGSAKYKLETTSRPGYEAKERLNIPPNHVGVLKIGEYRLILPPRIYTNIPTGDDEILVTPALCVGPGSLAWKYDFNSQLVVKTAQQECYAEPAEGWTFEPALQVGQGQIAWRLKPDGTIEKINTPGIYPNEFAKNWQPVESYLVVSPNSLAYRLKEDGTYEFRGPNPGVYQDEIDSMWTHAEAIEIQPNSFGIYLRNGKDIVFLPPGLHFEAVTQFLRVYLEQDLRYRTLSADSSKPEDPFWWVKDPNSDACASYLCGTIIDNVAISGTVRLASFNVDVIFSFESPAGDPTVLEKYNNLPSMGRAVQDFVEGPIREATRSVCNDMTQEVLQSEVGKLACERRILEKVNASNQNKGVPIIIKSVALRSRNFNDKDFRDQMAAEMDQVALAEAELRTIEAQTATQEALKRQIELKMDTVRQVLGGRTNVTCQDLVLLGAVGVIEFDPTKLPDGMCASGNTSITVTAP